jgi:predicted TIM-barrel fold metal-dependent hydrolase
VRIDVHQHAAGPDYLTEAGLQAGPHAEALVDVDHRLRQLDEAAIDVAVLSAPPPGPSDPDPRRAAELARLANDPLIAHAERHPDRFRVLAVLPFPHGGPARAELERIAGHPAVRGVCLHGHSAAWKVDAFEESGVAALCERAELPVLVHPAGDIRVDEPDPYGLSQVVGLPASSTAAVFRMIASGTLDRLPGLQLIVPHAGGLIGTLAGRAADQLRGTHAEAVSRYIERLWFDSCLGDAELLEFFMGRWGHERFVLGSDFPYRGDIRRHAVDFDVAASVCGMPCAPGPFQAWFG